MKITFLVIGKTTEKRVETLIDDYRQRLTHYAAFDIDVIPELRNTKALTIEQQKAQEAELLRQKFQSGDIIVLLDEHGTQRRSVDFAAWLQKKMLSGARRLVFVVGGPYGFDASIYKLAQEQMSLSLMTFSHQLVRLFFVEQLYRAFTILKNEPYHHE